MESTAPLTDSPDFQRMRRALACEEPDRVPLAELKVEEVVKGAFLGQALGNPEEDLEGYLGRDIEFSRRAGYDYVRLVGLASYPQPGREREDDYGRGLYTQGPRRTWAEQGRGFITSEEDLEAFPFPSVEDVDLRHLEVGSRLLPEGMEAFASIKGGGIFERAWRLMGFEGFCLAAMEKPELVAHLLERIGGWYCAVFERMAKFPRVAGLWLGDDLAYTEGFFVSPRVYRQHLFPWYERLAETCRQKGLFFIFHSDGRLWEILEDLITIGIHALHPIEPKAMDIREVKARVRGRLCLIGNVDLGYTLTRGSPREVEEEVKGLIRDLAPGGGWCLGSSNSITEYVPLENYVALLESARRWGEYPIAVS